MSGIVHTLWAFMLAFYAVTVYKPVIDYNFLTIAVVPVNFFAAFLIKGGVHEPAD
ncbi:hypothetical protein L4X63_02905 [Geomonas sp. Red32]|uniref:hypothetical protein n=1 Tax=Geomonas sp. Red32 TaxID=2912856 RepID=UPI00202CEFE1|nr:hypothetical protein [Geomonas sp. Red32]MCM0080531.1 hypothetical protein [Geomonas sp. Red32]